MSSQVDIANQSLARLGALPIVNFDDGSPEANLMKTNYDSGKKYMLRCFPWRCATKTKSLALLAEQPVDEYWKFAFSLPEDCLRIESVMENSYPYSRAAKWEVQGKTVLARVNNIIVDYMSDIEEPDFDAHVEQVLVAQLAKDNCYALTASSSREQNLIAIYDRILMEAKTTDRQEASHKTFQIDTLVRER